MFCGAERVGVQSISRNSLHGSKSIKEKLMVCMYSKGGVTHRTSWLMGS